MKELNIKRILAREGLILLGVVILGLTIYFVSNHLNELYLKGHWESRLKVIGNMQYSLVGFSPYLKVMSLGLVISMSGYPVILIIRFIIWAVKRLKEK